jgi:PTS system fructose-specific IIC component
MLGSAVTGALSEAFDVSVRAPHGGIFVIFAVSHVPGYFIALIAGVLVGCAAVVAAKTVWPANDEDIVPVG